MSNYSSVQNMNGVNIGWNWYMQFDSEYTTCTGYTYTVAETQCAYCGVSTFSFDTTDGKFLFSTSDGLLSGLENVYTLTVKYNGATSFVMTINVHFNGTLCSQNYITNTSLSNVVYTIGSGFSSYAFNWPQYNEVCGTLKYSITINGSAYTTFPFIYAFQTTGTIQILGNTLTDAGYYNVWVGAVGEINVTGSNYFALTLINPCIGLSILSTTISTISYELLGTIQITSLGMLSYDTTYSICGALDYSLFNSSGLLPSQYSFSNTSNILTISSNDTTLCNTYQTLIFEGCYANWPATNLTVPVTVQYTCQCQTAFLKSNFGFYYLILFLGNHVTNETFSSFTYSNSICDPMPINYTLIDVSDSSSPLVSGTDYVFSTSSPLTFMFPQTWNANILRNHSFILNGESVIENTTLALNVTFNITIKRGCNASLTSYGSYIFNQSLSYRVFDVEAIYWFDDFVVTDPTHLSCGNFSYYLLWIVNSTYNTSTLPSFISYNVSNNSFSIFTNNSKYQGIYNLLLIGSLNSYVYLDYSFTLHVLQRCTPTYLQTPSESLVQTYVVGSKALSVLILPFTPNIICNGDSINYSGSLVSSQGVGGSAISFSSEYNTIVIQTNNTSYIGDYQYMITGQVIQDLTTVVVSNSMTFRITITTSTSDVSSAQPPQFSKALTDISIFADKTLTYPLPSVIDIQNFTVVMSFNQLPSFVKETGTSLQLAPSLADVGKYNSQITLTTMSASPLTTTYTLQIDVIDQNNNPSGISPAAAAYLQMHGDSFIFNSEKINKTQLTGELKASISSIDQQGNIQVVFDDNLLSPDVFDPLILLNALTFTLQKSNGTLIQYVNNITFNNQSQIGRMLGSETNVAINSSMWNFTMFKENIINIKMNFPDPTIISDGAVRHFDLNYVQTYDQFLVKFNQRYFFISSDKSKIVSANYQLSHSIPPQITNSGNTPSFQPSTLAVAQAISAAASGASGMITGAITGNMFLSVVLGLSMKKLWMMITTLQIMAHLPLLSIFLPSNAVMCFSSIVAISNMNIIPSQYTDAVLFVFVGSKATQGGNATTSGNFQTMNIFGITSFHLSWPQLYHALNLPISFPIQACYSWFSSLQQFQDCLSSSSGTQSRNALGNHPNSQRPLAFKSSSPKQARCFSSTSTSSRR